MGNRFSSARARGINRQEQIQKARWIHLVDGAILIFGDTILIKERRKMAILFRKQAFSSAAKNLMLAPDHD
jgi:hypothetical protein